MKYTFLILGLILVLIVSCTKSGSGGLSVKISSISNTYVPQGGSTTITFDFTDNGGNPIDSIYMNRIRINQDSASVPVTTNIFNIQPPSYSGGNKGQIQLSLIANGFLVAALSPPLVDTPNVYEPDSVIIKFAFKDVANHKSDTLTTGLIVVQR